MCFGNFLAQCPNPSIENIGDAKIHEVKKAAEKVIVELT